MISLFVIIISYFVRNVNGKVVNKMLRNINKKWRKIKMSDNRCVCCGAIIPEGRQVCYRCERGKFKRFGALLNIITVRLYCSKI